MHHRSSLMHSHHTGRGRGMDGWIDVFDLLSVFFIQQQLVAETAAGKLF